MRTRRWHAFLPLPASLRSYQPSSAFPYAVLKDLAAPAEIPGRFLLRPLEAASNTPSIEHLATDRLTRRAMKPWHFPVSPPARYSKAFQLEFLSCHSIECLHNQTRRSHLTPIDSNWNSAEAATSSFAVSWELNVWVRLPHASATSCVFWNAWFLCEKR